MNGSKACSIQGGVTDWGPSVSDATLDDDRLRPTTDGELVIMSLFFLTGFLFGVVLGGCWWNVSLGVLAESGQIKNSLDAFI